jgi:hypothetical protein
MKKDRIFKKCPSCGTTWPSRTEFIMDDLLSANGYQPDFDSLEEGLFLFTHHKQGCHSTIAVTVGNFVDLYQGPRYSERKKGTGQCEGLCMELYNLRLCKSKCECAYIREVLNIINKQKNVTNSDNHRKEASVQ